MEHTDPIKVLCRGWKAAAAGNPISPDIYCADPTAVEFEGRLYVYGTNDHQQFDAVDGNGKNTYEAIKSLVVFSTDDMVNWVYHGTIDVAKIAPWIYSSWAPSVISRKEADGLTHFYLYFSHSGAGVGVITATHPLGPWSDPLGKPLILNGMPELGDVPNPFDPGACIDDQGVGWLAFGGGVAANGSEAMPHTARIVRLGADMLSFASEFKEIPAPYFYEASEMNFVGGTYCYTYNTNWAERSEWAQAGIEPPSRCSMVYMTTRTPLDSDSWVCRGHYFANPGDFGYPDSNNHTHLHPFRGRWFLFYHTLQREVGVGETGGFRSLCVTEMQVDSQTAAYTRAAADDTGVPQLQPLDPYTEHHGATLATDAAIRYRKDAAGLVTAAESAEKGAWLCVRGVDLGSGATRIVAAVSGQGTVELRLDCADGRRIGVIPCSASDMQEVSAKLSGQAGGVHDLYFVFSDADIALYRWRMQ